MDINGSCDHKRGVLFYGTAMSDTSLRTQVYDCCVRH